LAVDIYLAWPEQPEDQDDVASALRAELSQVEWLRRVERITVSVAGRAGDVHHHQFTFQPGEGGELVEDTLIRGMHPMVARRLQLQRLANFDLTRLPSADEDVYLFRCVAKQNPADERLIAMAQVRDLTPLRDSDGRLITLPAAEGALAACLAAIRSHQAERSAKSRLDTNRVLIYCWPPSDLSLDELRGIVHRAAPSTSGAGIREVMFVGQQRNPETGELTDAALRISSKPGEGLLIDIIDPPTEPITPLDDYAQRVLRARRRGTTYPYELTGMLAGPHGSFVEYDLDDRGELVPVDRAPGGNKAAIVAGVVSTPTERYPEGVTRGAQRAGMGAGHRGAGPRGEDAGPAGVVRAVGGREDLDGLGHGESRLGRPRVEPHRPVHPGGRRDQCRGGRHQRRCAAVLEC